MRLLLIVNNSASSVTPRARVVIQRALATEHDVQVAPTSRRGHATLLAQGASRAGMDAVIVLGGDGTLNEAANGLVGTHTALGVLPGGSTNVFARTIGTKHDAAKATDQLLAALARGSRRRISVGSVNGRYFLFHVGIGFDAAVVEQVERRASLKRWAGHPLFVYAGFLTWFRKYDKSRPRFSLSTPGALSVDGYFSIVLNTNPYTYLGSRRLEVAPEATFERGLVSITFRTLRFRTVMGAIISALGTGKRSRNHPEIDRRVDLDECTARGYGPVPYQVDGDFLGEIEHLEFRHVRDCLDVIMP